MHFLKNKHLILAMFVAPVLAIIAYFSVDYYVSETPHAALEGGSYKLAAKSNCRYKSGVCTLKNGDIEIKLRARKISAEQLELILTSGIPLQSALVSFVEANASSAPRRMTVAPADVNTWSAKFYKFDSAQGSIRLALNISDTLYYAETSAIFIDYETAFSRDNFTN